MDKTIRFRVGEELVAALKAEAQKQRRSVGALIRLILEEALGKQAQK
jgi:hypothetical protein